MSRVVIRGSLKLFYINIYFSNLSGYEKDPIDTAGYNIAFVYNETERANLYLHDW